MKEFKRASQALGEKGYRLTPQRLMILEAIEDSEGHISAEEIYEQVRGKYPHLNISTVYRTLELLKELGLATVTDFGEGRVRYHPVEKGRHHHLVCRTCGAVRDIDESVLKSLEKKLLREYRFRANLSHFAIFGHCLDCEKSAGR